MNYYISDLHLFCKNQTKSGTVNHDNRPFENIGVMHATILEKWNKKITNGDTVYILGDISMRGKCDELIALVAQLKGKKVLIKGNHDDLTDLRYKQLFAEICDYKELQDNFEGRAYKLVLSHYPILMWNGQHKGVMLLYGHTHNSIEDTYYKECLRKMNESIELRHEGDSKIRAYNVGCMHSYMDYEPRTLKEILVANEEDMGVLHYHKTKKEV